MKKYSYFMVAILLVACGGEENQNTENNAEPEVTEVEADMSLPDEDMAPEAPYEPLNEDGVWQIDDYAEMFTGAKVYKSHDDVPEDQRMSGNWYEVLDLKGGYARVTGAYEGWYEYVLWRMNNGKDLLGTMSAGCGPACDYDFQFYECEGEKTRALGLVDIMPKKEMDEQLEKMHQKVIDKYQDGIDYKEDYQYLFHFPQKGTAMEVDMVVGADEMTIPILKLSWDKERFHIEKMYDEIKERN